MKSDSTTVIKNMEFLVKELHKEGAIDWRELYEILSYMVKQPFYCGEDQKRYYQETKQKADRDKMNPVYKRFFDIEDSVKANRLEFKLSPIHCSQRPSMNSPFSLTIPLESFGSRLHTSISSGFT